MWDLAGGEARHQAVGVRSHQVGGLGLLAEPCEVLRALEAPEPGPSLSRCVAVEGGDEVDEKLRHGGVPFSGVTSLDRPGSTNSSAALCGDEEPMARQRPRSQQEDLDMEQVRVRTGDDAILVSWHPPDRPADGQ